MTFPIPSIPTTTAQTASQPLEGTNTVPSTVAQTHTTTTTSTTTTIPSSQSLSKASSVDTSTSTAQLQGHIQELSAKLKSLRTERERLESGDTEEQHMRAMGILEQEQTLERKLKEASFRQKQISSKQTNTGTAESKQKPNEQAILQNRPSNKCYKLALRLR